MVNTLRELITRIDAPLANHLNEQGIEFIQFSFRWMNCLLMREFSIGNVIRMWDTYVVCPWSPVITNSFIPFRILVTLLCLWGSFVFSVVVRFWFFLLLTVFMIASNFFEIWNETNE